MKDLVKTFSVLFFISAAIRFVDVIKNLIVASKLGVTYQGDVFLSISALPDSLLILFGLDSLKGVVNSEYSSELNSSVTRVKDSLNNLFWILVLAGLLITSGILLFKEPLIKILLPGFSNERLELALAISIFILPVFFFKPVGALLFAYYNSIKRFYYPVIFQVSVSVFILLMLVVPIQTDGLLYNISMGFLFGNIFYFLVMLGPQIFNGNINLSKRPIVDALTKKVIKNCSTLFFVVVINQLYLFSKNFFVSYFDEGSIAAINYGSSVPVFVSAMTFTVVFGVLLNNLSKLYSQKDITEAAKLLSRTINSVIFLYVPIVIIFFVFGRNILNILYLRGNFDAAGIELTLIPFMIESVSLIPYVYFIFPVALYLAFKEYKKYSVIGIVVYGLGILANFFLTKYFGFYGVSIGSFVVYSVLAILEIKFSEKSTGSLVRLLKDSFKMLLIGIALALIIFFVKENLLTYLFPFNNLMPLLLGGFLTLILYYFLTLIFKVNYLRQLQILYRK